MKSPEGLYHSGSEGGVASFVDLEVGRDEGERREGVLLVLVAGVEPMPLGIA